MYAIPLLAAILDLGAADAHATDSKQYGGGFCVAWSGSRSLNAGRSRNTSSTTTAKLDCPAIIDSIEYTLTDASYMNVIDNNASSGQHVECTLIAAESDGSGTSLTSVKRSTGDDEFGDTFSSSVPQALYFDEDPYDSLANWYYLSCSLPPKGAGFSYIVDYFVQEDN